MHMRQMLREMSRQRTVGFGDAVDDLGTPVICGHEVPYSRAMVYNLLKGKSRSERLLKRIIEFRPDLLELSWTEKCVINRAREMGWAPRSKRTGAKESEAERSSAHQDGDFSPEDWRGK